MMEGLGRAGWPSSFNIVSGYELSGHVYGHGRGSVLCCASCFLRGEDELHHCVGGREQVQLEKKPHVSVEMLTQLNTAQRDPFCASATGETESRLPENG